MSNVKFVCICAVIISVVVCLSTAQTGGQGHWYQLCVYEGNYYVIDQPTGEVFILKTQGAAAQHGELLSRLRFSWFSGGTPSR